MVRGLRRGTNHRDRELRRSRPALHKFLRLRRPRFRSGANRSGAAFAFRLKRRTPHPDPSPLGGIAHERPPAQKVGGLHKNLRLADRLAQTAMRRLPRPTLRPPRYRQPWLVGALALSAESLRSCFALSAAGEVGSEGSSEPLD